jgi:hypothetical protein
VSAQADRVERCVTRTGVVVFFASHRAALLACATVPEDVRATVSAWDGDDDRPFWVELDYDRPWLRPPRPSKGFPGLRSSLDLYGFGEPVTFRAPSWWLSLVRAWRAA